VKLLLMCYECSPYMGSEWAVGWGRLLGAAKLGETHVVTSETNFFKLQRARAEGLVPENVFFHTPEPDAKLRALEKTPGMFAYNYKAYNHWQRLALAYVKELHARIGFDLTHQVNVCTFREPGYTAELGIPFLWGPMGGSQNFPPRFLPMLPAKEAVKEGIRGVTNWMTLRHPRVRAAAKEAALVLAANSTNLRDFSRAFAGKVELLLETGIHDFQEPDRFRFEERVRRAAEGVPQGPLQLLWSGELHTRKALPVLLRALTRLKDDVAWKLDVLGDGPMRAGWLEETTRLGLGDRVRFLGRQTFTDAVAEMHSAHVLCFTSLRDTSGNVILEALAAGVPVICFDHQGAGDMVTALSGVKLPVASPKQAYADWAETIAMLAKDPRRLRDLSYGATARARDFLWSGNHNRINAIYRELVGETSGAEAVVGRMDTEGEVYRPELLGVHETQSV
jgi:glycosyltransferase involved in cell wall biosynthesis